MDVQQARAALANGTIKLTDKGLRDLPTPLKGSVIYTDGGILEVRVTAAGACAWVYRYRHNGRSVTYTIGDPLNMKASRASKEAARLYELVRQGCDPQGERRAVREAPTVKELCARYLEEHAARKRSAAEDRRMIDKVILPALGARKVAEIEFADLDQLHRRLTTKGTRTGYGRGAPYMANRVVSLLSKMFSLAIQWKLRSDNPAKGIGRNTEAKRKRYLSDDEIPRLCQALAEYPHQQSANAIRLLMLTGARRMEVLSATWDQVDLSRGAWTKPDSATKDKREHTIPLSAPALELLSEMKAEAKSEYLFPGRGVDHLSDLKKPWAVIAKNAKLDGVRVHDLRHSFASILVSSGRTLAQIGALLGHASAQTTQRYAHADIDSLRSAVDTVGAKIMQRPKAEVEPIRVRR
jgi:integrase